MLTPPASPPAVPAVYAMGNLTDSPRVSVVMGTYDDAATLAAAVDSVLSQSFADFEFIIVNDGSPDPDTAAILADFARRDSRVQVITKANEGLTKALIAGCAAARGEYIARQDADDVSLPGRLAAQVALLDAHPDVVLCTSGVRCVAPGGEAIETLSTSSSIEEQTRRLREDMVGVPAHGCVMFRRVAYTAVGGYRWPFYYAQDSDLWLRLIEVGSAGSAPGPFYELRESTGSISSRHRPAQLGFCRLARECYLARRQRRPEEPFLRDAASLRERVLCRLSTGAVSAAASAATLRIVAARLASQGDRVAARRYLWQAMGAAPWDLRCWRDLLRSMASGSARR